MMSAAEVAPAPMECANGEGSHPVQDLKEGQEEEEAPQETPDATSKGPRMEGADSTTTLEGEDGAAGDGATNGDKSAGKALKSDDFSSADENKVTSTGNGGNGKKRERSQEGEGASQGSRPDKRRRAEDSHFSSSSSTSRNPSYSSRDRRPPPPPPPVYRDARDRIEDRRRQNRQYQHQQQHHSRGGSSSGGPVVDYVSRADRVLMGRGTRHCVECNLVFVTERSERLHRDSQRHRAVYEDRKRPTTLSSRRETPYACYLCWVTYDSSGQLFRHYASGEHVQRMIKWVILSVLLRRKCFHNLIFTGTASRCFWWTGAASRATAVRSRRRG